jgi:hypothetical protein
MRRVLWSVAVLLAVVGAYLYVANDGWWLGAALIMPPFGLFLIHMDEDPARAGIHGYSGDAGDGGS